MEVGESRLVGGAPLLAAIAREIGVVEIIDRNVSWDSERSKLSPGERILALILNLLTRRQPLYKVWECYYGTDVELLLGEGITIEDLNDDALGRALDKLQTAGPKLIYSSIATQALSREGEDLSFLHYDTTSKSLEGEYATATGEDAVKPTYGYSKDHRPDLKQIILALFCNRDGIAVAGDVQDGNRSDKKLNGEMIERLVEMFSPAELLELVYVADSALVTDENLRKLATVGVRFLSRLPETYKISAEVKALAWQSDWTAIGKISPHKDAAEYWASEQKGVIAEREYRLVVFRSSHLDERKAKSLEKELIQERQRLEKEAAVLAEQSFFCREDAEAAGKSWLKKNGDAFHELSMTVVKTQEPKKRGKRGRPRQDEKPEIETAYHVAPQVGERLEEAVKAERERRSTFVLITVLPKEGFPATKLLVEYKGQTAVEQRFRFLKDPSFVDAFFLHKPERVEALGYAMMLAALVFSIMERRIRHYSEPLVTPSRGKLINPTGREAMQNMRLAQVTKVDAWHRQFSILPLFRAPFRTVINACGFDERIYKEVPVRRSG